MNELKLTAEEVKAIEALKEVEKIWPKSLWLFSGSGSLNILKKKNGKRAMTRTAGYDAEYIVGHLGIENDGGDW